MVRRARRRLQAAGITGLRIIVACVFLLPILFMISTALKDMPTIYRDPPVYVPLPPHWENFIGRLTAYVPFPHYMGNSFIIASLATIGDVAAGSFVAYGFAILRFPLRNLLFTVLLGTLMIPFFVRMIPLFIMYRSLGWIDTFLPLIVPSFFGTPLFVFLMRQHYLTVPVELIDAARIDGASEVRIWAQVMVPLSGAVLAAVAILAFQYHWNEFAEPLVFLTSEGKRTAVLGLYSLLTPQEVIQWNVVMASTIMLVLPVVGVFLAFQRAFIEGGTVTGIRG